MSDYDFCVVGAGPAGLTLAYKLATSGASVLVVERSERAGGLSKSFALDGHTFDIGPKRFHTEDPLVLNFLQEVSGGDLLTIGRSTKVHFLGRYLEWPLSTKDLFRLPVGLSLRCFFDLFERQRPLDNDSFADHIKAKYGNSLYQTFFAPYTSKFLRIDAEAVHADWASTGINRSIVDSRAKGNSLVELASSLVIPRRLDTKFLYPSSGGFGGFWDRLYQRCLATERCTFLFKDTIASLREEETRVSAVTQGGQQITCGRLCWSGNLNDLLAALNLDSEAPRLQYLNTLFYFIILEGREPRHRAQWIYISDKAKLISRITCFKEFAAYLCKEGEYGLCCEVTDHQSHPEHWHQANERISQVVGELESLGFVNSSTRVKAVHVHKQQDTYPVYHKNYARDFNAVRKVVKSAAPRISLVGRTGAFWYNNSDHSIRMALNMADHLIDGLTPLMEYRQYFGGGLRH